MWPVGVSRAGIVLPLVIRGGWPGFRRQAGPPERRGGTGAAVRVGLALAARAWRPLYWPAAVAGAGFMAAHASIHLVAIVAGHDHHIGFDLAAVVLPSALALYSAFPNQGERHA